MKNNCKIPHPLNRKGTSQNERIPKASGKDYVKLDERNILDLIRQSAEYSKYIAYYDSKNPDTIASDWQNFFSSVYDFNTHSLKIKSVDELKLKSDLSPHLALFITFLHLFQLAIENLNELPVRHLKFFYEEILQIKHKKANPDKAIIFAEISKGYDNVQIKENINLIAGKDIYGKELKYRTVDETIINKASIADIKTFFVERDKDAKVHNISAAFKTDTLDGIGEPLTSSPPSWKTFGSAGKIQAEVGFAIWSPILNMPEGIRTIIISLPELPEEFQDNNLENLKIEYTSVKKWEPAEYIIDKSKLKIFIRSQQPAFIPFSNVIHSGGYEVSAPILKITLKNNKHSVYNILQKVTFTDLNVIVDVQDFKSLILQNDNGDIDPSKPFFPFGNRPAKDSSKFIIGNQYAFNKYLTRFTLNPVTKPHLKNIDFSRIEALANAQWKTYTTNVFENDYSIEEDDLQFNSHTKNNFIRITNLDDELEIYNSLLAAYLIEVRDNPQKTPPSTPYILELESLTMNYTTESEMFNDSANSGVFHVHPFGYDKYISQSSKIVPELPVEGNLFLGISDIKKGQSVSIHFLMKESSGNPDEKTMGVTWHYLNHNKAVAFNQSDIVKDTTNNFTNSGIIIFAIPPEAFSLSTLLPSGYLWLYASCESQSQAYPEMIYIRTQSFEIEFSDNANDAERLSKPLNPQSVLKFEFPMDGIKKIVQPYSSYNGKMSENSLSFNNRVSELLRHRHRAINIWDYERLVLEEFPEIYRVKCISHSAKDTEYFPGNVLLVVVPQLYNLNTQEVFEPKVSVGIREKILRFISRYTSPFVKIEVINPIYEQIEVTCHVSFYDNISDKEFYSATLSDNIKNYFIPWKSEEKNSLNFHGKFYKSQIINFIEERKYVDYISFIEIKKHSLAGVEILDDLISASNESVVLTSYKSHTINPYAKC